MLGRRMTLPRWILLLVSLAAGCSRPDDAKPASDGALLDSPAYESLDAEPAASVVIPADAPAVVFLSDSIGAGLHLGADQAFPAVVQRRLAREGLAFKLVNASESGRTSAGGLAALDWVLRSEPEVVVVGLGGNDGLRGIAVSEIERNLRAILDGVRAAGAEPLLLGVRLPLNYGDYGRAFDALYPALAEETDAAFVPFYMEGVGGVPEMNLTDGLHPSPAGHERLADNVAPVLRRLLADLAVTDER
jgi:acyl-CoA thioesterase-1